MNNQRFFEKKENTVVEPMNGERVCFLCLPVREYGYL